MNYKAIIFDLDGTLVHTPQDYVKTCLEKTLAELGSSAVLTDEIIKEFWFYTGRNKIVENVFNLDVGTFWKNYRKNDKPDLRKRVSRAYKDTKIIKELKKRYRLGIVTGAEKAVAHAEMELMGSGIFNSLIIAKQSEGIEPKPNPEGVYLCLKELGVESSETIFVGNGGEDIEAAKTAGVFDILIDRGEHPYIGLSPKRKINSLGELQTCLD